MDAAAPPIGDHLWMRPLLVLLAVPNLVAGSWALLAPSSWFGRAVSTRSAVVRVLRSGPLMPGP
jgi:hypothetical protein